MLGATSSGDYPNPVPRIALPVPRIALPLSLFTALPLYLSGCDFTEARLRKKCIQGGYRRLGLSGALRYVAHIRYQAHARFLAQSRKNLVKRRTFQLNAIWGGATAHKSNGDC